MLQLRNHWDNKISVKVTLKLAKKKLKNTFSIYFLIYLFSPLKDTNI